MRYNIMRVNKNAIARGRAELYWRTAPLKISLPQNMVSVMLAKRYFGKRGMCLLVV